MEAEQQQYVIIALFHHDKSCVTQACVWNGQMS